ncbi:MAG: hypothetical protein AB1861_01875 [Cyanobacteriota bacterium]
MAFKTPAQVDIGCLLVLGYAADELIKPDEGRFGLDRVYYGESYGYIRL